MSNLDPPMANDPSWRERAQQGALESARCIRSQGMTQFPDPGSDGEIRIAKGAPGLNLNSPLFQFAQEACHDLLPGSPSFGAKGTSG
jgi:hypothetical protein